MGNFTSMAALAAALTWAGVAGAADAPVAADTTCTHTIANMPKEVRSLLLPTYEAKKGGDLVELSHSLRMIQAEVEECRGYFGTPAYQSPKKQEELADWRSLEEWVNRIAVLMDLEVQGMPTLNWRDEFKIFTDLFEIPI